MSFRIGEYYDPALASMPKDEVKDNLQSICWGMEERSYTKTLTEEELRDRKNEYSQIGIKLSELEEEKKNVLDNFKESMKRPKSRATELVKAIKYKSEQIYGKLFMVDDQESKMMFLFDENGICVDARTLTKEERQIRLKSVNQ